MTTETANEKELDFQIINWIGIINQLTSAKMRQLLDGTDVPPPQFSLLNHFSHRPQEGKTVTAIANAMQQPQPGITKTIAKMVTKEFLKEEQHPIDKRSKVLYLTPKGIKAHLLARQKLISGMDDTFNGWASDEKEALFDQLNRLKTFLDDNR